MKQHVHHRLDGLEEQSQCRIYDQPVHHRLDGLEVFSI